MLYNEPEMEKSNINNVSRLKYNEEIEPRAGSACRLNLDLSDTLPLLDGSRFSNTVQLIFATCAYRATNIPASPVARSIEN